MLKFACVPVKFAPKRKMINFAIPKFRTKLGEFVDPDLVSWVRNLYQDKMFKTTAEFKLACSEMAQNWDHRPMVISSEDLVELNEQFEGGAFDDGQKKEIGKLIGRMITVMGAEKVVFVY